MREVERLAKKHGPRSVASNNAELIEWADKDEEELGIRSKSLRLVFSDLDTRSVRSTNNIVFDFFDSLDLTDLLDRVGEVVTGDAD